MRKNIDAQSQQEHSTSQSYQKLPVRGARFYFGVLDETEETENKQPQTRWNHKVGGWMCRRSGALIRWFRRHSTFIIMLATVVNVAVAHRQWGAMIEEVRANQKSAKAAEDQLTEMRSSSADTRIVADATQKNVATAQAALDASIERDRRDQRAWVGLSNVQVLNKFTVGEPLKIRAMLANSGKSPAIGVSVNGYMDFLMIAEGDRRNPFTEEERYAPCVQPKPVWSDTLGGMMLLPGPNTGSLDRLSPPVPGVLVKIATHDSTKKLGLQDLTDVERDEISNIRAVPGVPPDATLEVGIYFVGCVDYFDIFHVVHRTTFCLKYLHNRMFEPEIPRGAFAPCEYGNSGD